MGAVRGETIEGFNKFLADQQALESPAVITLVQFSHELITTLDAVPITKAESLCDKSYVPSGSTALLDAIGATITRGIRRLRNKRPKPRVVIVIQTDGFENASREFTRDAVLHLISKQRKRGWQFIFLGCNQDAIEEGQKLGVAAGSSLSYAPTGKGTLAVFAATSDSIGKLRNDKKNVTFSEDERALQQKLLRRNRLQRPSQN